MFDNYFSRTSRLDTGSDRDGMGWDGDGMGVREGTQEQTLSELLETDRGKPPTPDAEVHRSITQGSARLSTHSDFAA